MLKIFSKSVVFWMCLSFGFLVASCFSKPTPGTEEAVVASEDFFGGGDMSLDPDSALTGSDIGGAGGFFGGGSASPEFTVFFGFDEYTLNSSARATVEGLAQRLNANPNARVRIEGHCDERGSVEYNLALGNRRAEAVRRYLVQLGIRANRISTVSYGKERPVADGSYEAAWARNRRAEFVIID